MYYEETRLLYRYYKRKLLQNAALQKRAGEVCYYVLDITYNIKGIYIYKFSVAYNRDDGME